MYKFWLIVIGWIGIGYCNYHFTLGEYTKEFPSQNHVGISTMMAVGGPFAIPAVLVRGLTWRDSPMPCQERWEFDWRETHAQYPGLADLWEKENFLNTVAPDCRGEHLVP